MADNNESPNGNSPGSGFNEEEFEELDLTPYEDDKDEVLHRKLIAAKMARKRAEDDLKLLCNRIGLLK